MRLWGWAWAEWIVYKRVCGCVCVCVCVCVFVCVCVLIVVSMNEVGHYIAQARRFTVAKQYQSSYVLFLSPHFDFYSNFQDPSVLQSGCEEIRQAPREYDKFWWLHPGVRYAEITDRSLQKKRYHPEWCHQRPLRRREYGQLDHVWMM